MVYDSLKIVIWNANGLNQRVLELKAFLIDQNVDVALISETHFTTKSFIQIPNYKIITTNHPSGRGHGGTAIIVKKTIQYTEQQPFLTDYLQSTSIQLRDKVGPLTISSIYCPPKHKITIDQYCSYMNTLGNRFLIGGDFNAKHVQWGSRINNVKGKALIAAINKQKCFHLSTGEPTYWPSDIHKKPDLIDFCIAKNIPKQQILLKSCFDLSSDHSPIVINLLTTLEPPPSQYLYNKKTDWDFYRDIVKSQLLCNISLKQPDDIDKATVYLNDVLVEAATVATPASAISRTNTYTPEFIKSKIKEKRKLRKTWQRTRLPLHKTVYNRAVVEVKLLLKEFEDQKTATYLQNLTATASTDYSLWKAVKVIKSQTISNPPLRKHDGTWAKTNNERAELLAVHFKEIFSNENNNNTLLAIIEPNDPDICPKFTNYAEIIHCISKKMNPGKSPGYDLISTKMLLELPAIAIIFIRNLFNAIMRLHYFPKVWKIAQIIAIPKPGKDANNVSSYRPISLLPTISKVFERIFADRLDVIIQQKDLLPNHQFGFRKKHSTIQQIHRVTNKIITDFDNKMFCVSVFLDVAKAFDKVWHEGLLFKLKSMLPENYFKIIKSYLHKRKFFVKHKDGDSNLYEIKAGVPQGSVLGPILYLLYTADVPVPTPPNTMLATFADDTAILSSGKSIYEASIKLQNSIDKITSWFNRWNLKINEEKTVQVIFTTRTKYVPQPIFVNGLQIALAESAKYLGMHLDSKLNWKNHISAKTKQIKLQLNNLKHLLGKYSSLSMTNKLTLYKMIIKPIWTYGIEIWGTASATNIKPISVIQNKILRLITNAYRFIPNTNIRNDLHIESVEQEIAKRIKTYIQKTTIHQNQEIRELSHQDLNSALRLRRFRPTDLQIRFQ